MEIKKSMKENGHHTLPAISSIAVSITPCETDIRANVPSHSWSRLRLVQAHLHLFCSCVRATPRQTCSPGRCNSVLNFNSSTNLDIFTIDLRIMEFTDGFISRPWFRESNESKAFRITTVPVVDEEGVNKYVTSELDDTESMSSVS